MNGEDKVFWVALALLVLCVVVAVAVATPRQDVCAPYARKPLYSVVAKAKNLTLINAGEKTYAVLTIVAATNANQAILTIARATSASGGTPIPISKLDKKAPEPSIQALVNATTRINETLIAAITPTTIETYIVLRPGESITTVCTETCIITLHIG